AEKAIPQIKRKDARMTMLFGLGLALYRAGQHERAVTRLRESLALIPDWAARDQMWLALVLASQKLGRTGDADIALAEAQKISPEPGTRVGNQVGLSDQLASTLLWREVTSSIKK